MRRQWQISTIFLVLTCLLGGTVEPGLALQTHTPQKAPVKNKKTTQKKTKQTAATLQKKQKPGAGKNLVGAKREKKQAKGVAATKTTKKPGGRSDMRSARVKRGSRTVARHHQRRHGVRSTKRSRSTQGKVARNSHPIITKDFESVILANAENGEILFAEEIDKQWPAASLTKMMVGLLAMEDIEEHRFSLLTPVVISERATRARGRIIGLRTGETFPLGELLQTMLVTSANDASVAVAERIRGSVEACVAAMNRRAQNLGMGQTEFQTVNGLPLPDGRAGDFSSARDLVTLARVLSRYKLVLDWTSHDHVPFRDGIMILPNTNRLIGRVDGVTGLKTGFTARARYNLVATAQRGSLSLIAVVLGGRSSRIRFDTAAQYLEWGFSAYREQSVLRKEKDLEGRSMHHFRTVGAHVPLH